MFLRLSEAQKEPPTYSLPQTNGNLSDRSLQEGKVNLGPSPTHEAEAEMCSPGERPDSDKIEYNY